MNIPFDELSSRVKELAGYMEKNVALICQTDLRSEKAAQLLAQRGFADVHVVKQGMTDWNKKGYQVVG